MCGSSSVEGRARSRGSATAEDEPTIVRKTMPPRGGEERDKLVFSVWLTDPNTLCHEGSTCPIQPSLWPPDGPSVPLEGFRPQSLMGVKHALYRPCNAHARRGLPRRPQRGPKRTTIAAPNVWDAPRRPYDRANRTQFLLRPTLAPGRRRRHES